MSAAASKSRYRPKGKFFDNGRRCREDKDAPRRTRLTGSGRKKRHLRPGEIILGRCQCGEMVRATFVGDYAFSYCDGCTPPSHKPSKPSK